MISAAAFEAPAPRPTFMASLHPATRLGWLALFVAVAMAAPWPAVAVLSVALAAALAATGLGAGAQVRQLRPWLPMATLALVIHTLTTTAAAPLGHPSWAGVGAGLRALLRLGTTLAALAVYLRSGSLDDLVAGLGWWLRPLGRAGLSVDDLSLSVAVACGTVPQVIGEGRRLQTVTRLRRHFHDGSSGRAAPLRPRPGRLWLDRARLVVPLLETLGRRAGTLELALRGRRPAAGTAGGPRAGEWAGLGTGFLTAAALMLLRGGR